MNVYAETNFILELALQRAEREECARLLAMARRGTIRLLLPSFSVGEPYEALVRRARQRAELGRRLEIEIDELGRSAPYAGSTQALGEVLGMLSTSVRDEKQQLDSVSAEVLGEAELIPMTAGVFQTAKEAESAMELTPRDAMVFASVVADLERSRAGEKCFVASNARDFSESAAQARLAQHGCKLLTRFTDAVGYVRSRD